MPSSYNPQPQTQQPPPPQEESSFVPPLLTTDEKAARERLREINEKIRAQREAADAAEAAAEALEKAEEKGKRKRTVRRKLHTGKINDRVSILIPNKTIRNRVNATTQKNRQTSLPEIKQYLLKRGFIKVGTNAPADILRKMYEDLEMLGGKIQNASGENIVYNFKLG